MRPRRSAPPGRWPPKCRPGCARRSAGQRELIGPVPCYFARLAGVYRWQIVLRGPDPASLLRDKPLENWRVEIDPTSLL